jgi:hypothetical protein
MRPLTWNGYGPTLTAGSSQITPGMGTREDHHRPPPCPDSPSSTRRARPGPELRVETRRLPWLVSAPRRTHPLRRAGASAAPVPGRRHTLRVEAALPSSKSRSTMAAQLSLPEVTPVRRTPRCVSSAPSGTSRSPREWGCPGGSGGVGDWKSAICNSRRDRPWPQGVPPACRSL